MKILGIDPGTNYCGFGILSLDLNVIEFGLINVSKEKDFNIRLEIVCDNIIEIFKRHIDIDIVAIENVFFGFNFKSAARMCELRGALLYQCKKHNKNIFNYNPKLIKKIVTGNGNSDKKRVKKKVEELLNVKLDGYEDDVSDALAIALTFILKYKGEHKDEIEWKKLKKNKSRKNKQNEKRSQSGYFEQ